MSTIKNREAQAAQVAAERNIRISGRTPNDLFKEYNSLTVEIKEKSDQQTELRNQIAERLAANNNEFSTREFSGTLVIIPKSKKLVSFKVAEVVLKNNPTLWSAVQETKNASTRVLVKPLAQ